MDQLEDGLQGKSIPSSTAGLAGGASGASGKAGTNENLLNSKQSHIGLSGGASGASGKADGVERIGALITIAPNVLNSIGED